MESSKGGFFSWFNCCNSHATLSHPWICPRKAADLQVYKSAVLIPWCLDAMIQQFEEKLLPGCSTKIGYS